MLTGCAASGTTRTDVSSTFNGSDVGVPSKFLVRLSLHPVRRLLGTASAHTRHRRAIEQLFMIDRSIDTIYYLNSRLFEAACLIVCHGEAERIKRYYIEHHYLFFNCAKMMNSCDLTLEFDATLERERHPGHSVGRVFGSFGSGVIPILNVCCAMNKKFPELTTCNGTQNPRWILPAWTVLSTIVLKRSSSCREMAMRQRLPGSMGRGLFLERNSLSESNFAASVFHY